jgi:thiol-disulfide isomerase/thioredoxin
MDDGSRHVRVAVYAPLRRRSLLRIATAMVLTTTVAACDRLSSFSRESALFVEGRAVPPELLALISGEGEAARSWRGKMLVLNIWATWCGPCRHEMPSLNRLWGMLDPRKFAVVGISIDVDALLVSEFLLQNAIGYPNFLDPGGKVVRQLGLNVYPETLVISPDGSLVRRVTGWRDWSTPEMVGLIEGLYSTHQGSGPKSIPARH